MVVRLLLEKGRWERGGHRFGAPWLKVDDFW
jgi:hypothetical protein